MNRSYSKISECNSNPEENPFPVKLAFLRREVMVNKKNKYKLIKEY